MAALPLSTDALVLEKAPAATDGWERLLLFSADEGTLPALRRQNRRASQEFPLDLFDEASVVLESANQGRTWFLREARLLQRYDELGRSYGALLAASGLARIVALNPVGPESRASVYALLRSALEAAAASGRPDIVLFKSIYRFARDEGYPVKAEWRAELAAADRTEVDALLDRPIRELTLPAESVARLRRRLEDYLRAHTEILLD